MAESTSPKKPAEDATDRPRDQIIRLDSEREQRRAGAVIDDGELETPVALEPAALEAPTKEPQPLPAPRRRGEGRRTHPFCRTGPTPWPRS